MAHDSGLPEPTHRLPEPSAGSVPARALAPWRGQAPGWHPGTSLLPPALAAKPDLPGLLKALKRRWLLAFTLGIVLAAGTGAAIWSLLLPRYTVGALVRVATTPPYLMFRDPDASTREFYTYLKTQAAQIKSRFVLNAALKKDAVQALEEVRLQPEPLLWLEEELRVETQENSEFIHVSMMGPEPTNLVTLVNAATQAYLEEVIKAEVKRKSERLGELDKVRVQVNEKVRLKRETLRRMAEELGTSDKEALTQKQLNLLASYGELRRQHAGVKYEVLRAEGRLKAHQARLPELAKQPIPEAIVNEALGADPAIRQMVLRLNALDNIIADYKLNAVDPREPTRLRAQKQIDDLQKEMKKRMAELREDAVKQLRQRIQSDHEVTLAQLDKELEALTGQRDTLGEELEKVRESAERLGTSTTDLEMLKADIRQEDRTLERIADELHALRIELGSPARVSLYQEAGVQKRDTKRLTTALVLGPVGVFGLVCLLVAGFEFRTRRIQTADEVSAGLGMRVVGALPVLAGSVQRRLLTGAGTQEQSASEQCLLESIDGIRTLLLREASVEGTRVVMVTSAVAGEGKTTLAAHLASSLARAGRKTLLLDCDLRRPSLHQLFEQPMQPGFSEVLRGQVHLAEATRSTPLDGLWLIPAGQQDRAVLQALARDGLDDIFDRLKSDYDFIIVDAHPVLSASDALMIGQHVDAVLLSLLRDVSQAPRVFASCQRLRSLGMRVLGTVVHGLRQEDFYGNGYSYVQKAASV